MLQKCKKCGVTPAQDLFPCDPAGSSHEYDDELYRWKEFDSGFLGLFNEYLKIFLLSDVPKDKRSEMLVSKLYEITMYIHKNTELKK